MALTALFLLRVDGATLADYGGGCAWDTHDGGVYGVASVLMDQLAGAFILTQDRDIPPLNHRLIELFVRNVYEWLFQTIVTTVALLIASRIMTIERAGAVTPDPRSKDRGPCHLSVQSGLLTLLSYVGERGQHIGDAPGACLALAGLQKARLSHVLATLGQQLLLVNI